MTAFAPEAELTGPPPGPLGPPPPGPAVIPDAPPGVPIPGLPGATAPQSLEAPVTPEAAPPPPPEPTPPPPAADPYQVESLVAAIGIAPFLEHELTKVHGYHHARASKIGDEIDRKLHLFINRDEREPTAALPPFDFKAVRANIEAEVLPQHMEEVIGAFGDLPDVGLAATQIVERIRQYLAAKVPHRVHQSILGPQEEDPPHSDVARFRRLWAVACDPLSVLDDLNEYALSRDQAGAVADLYPLVWQRMDQGVTNALARKKAQSPKFRLSIRKENLLRILIKQENVVSMQLGVMLQAQFRKEDAEQAPKPPQAKKPEGADTESSASDRIGTT